MILMTQERIEKIYESLGDMQVTLDHDPLEFGPKRLNGKIAETRDHMSRLETLNLQLSQEHHALKREKRRLELELDFLYKDLLTNDPVVRAGRNVTDREACAKMKLKDRYDSLSNIQFAIEDYETLLRIIREKKGDLKDVQARLKDQIRVCQEEVALGARWGSRVPYAPDLATRTQAQEDEFLRTASSIIQADIAKLPQPAALVEPKAITLEDLNRMLAPDELPPILQPYTPTRNLPPIPEEAAKVLNFDAFLADIKPKHSLNGHAKSPFEDDPEIIF